MKRKGLRLKKVLAVMLVLCLVGGMLIVPDVGVVVEAAEGGEIEQENFDLSVVSSGEETYEYDGFSYTVLDNNTIELVSYKGTDLVVNIPSTIAGKTVTRMNNTFNGCSEVTSIIIPDSVTVIKGYSFENCNALTSIIVDENNTEYTSVDGVLYNKKLTSLYTCPAGKVSIDIPSSVIYIDSYAFRGCENLRSIIIPESVSGLGIIGAFKNCSRLERVVVLGNVTSIPHDTFSGCSSLSSIMLPESITSIGMGAFSGCSSLNHIIIPDNVTEIGESAFSGCSNLNDITMSKELICIGMSAFKGCSNLQCIMIPDRVVQIGMDAFRDCSNLSVVNLPESVTEIHSGAFAGCSNLISIKIPKNISSIEDNLFRDCSSLTSIIMSENIISIGNFAFYDCKNLSNVKLSENLLHIGDYAFNGCGIINIIIPESVVEINKGAFYGCSSLEDITIPKGVTSICNNTFHNCSSLSNITVPESVTSIETGAFFDCSSLNSITIPESVINISETAFQRCVNLTKIINKSKTVLDLTTINSRVQWYDTATGEPIDILSTGTAIALPKPVIIKKSDVILGDGSQFIDKYGNKINADNVVIVKSTIIQEQQDIIHAVEEITQNVAEKSKIFYYDISAHINAIGGEPAILSGNITIRLAYPAGVTKDYDIVVLHNTSRLEDVKKYDNYLTFKTDGLSPFTIIALEAEQASGDNAAVRDFVNRLYTLVLAREADETGLVSWTNALVTKQSSGVDAGYGFVFSDECKGKNLSNENFVEILYNTFMNRPSDEGGKSAWISQLDAGVEREKVFEGFIYSAEFAEICESYGINVGNISDVGALVNALSNYRNQNADITKFVARCYTEAMGRAYEPDGLEAWCKVIIEKSNTPKQVAQNFIFSDEFTGKNLNNEEYVMVLYRTFMGREADEGGLAAWVEVLKSGHEDRVKVLEGFSDSAEFAEILQSFGLN